MDNEKRRAFTTEVTEFTEGKRNKNDQTYIIEGLDSSRMFN